MSSGANVSQFIRVIVQCNAKVSESNEMVLVITLVIVWYWGNVPNQT